MESLCPCLRICNDVQVHIHFLPTSKEERLRTLQRLARKKRTDWTCPKTAKIGEVVFFALSGTGIVASGIVASETDKVKTGQWKGKYWAWIRSVSMLATPVPLASLIARFPSWGWPTYPRPYCSVESPLSESIRDYIAIYQAGLVDDPLPDELYSEGRPKTTMRTDYERSLPARRACLEKWGYGCLTCGRDFGLYYGERFVQYIHVHHLQPMATRKASYVINGARDLRPLCPNCHAVAHRNDPPFSISQIKKFISEAERAKHL